MCRKSGRGRRRGAVACADSTRMGAVSDSALEGFTTGGGPPATAETWRHVFDSSRARRTAAKCIAGSLPGRVCVCIVCGTARHAVPPFSRWTQNFSPLRDTRADIGTGLGFSPWVFPQPKSRQAKSAQAKSVTWLGVTWLERPGLDLTWLGVTWLGVTWLALLLRHAQATARLLQARVQRNDKEAVQKVM